MTETSTLHGWSTMRGAQNYHPAAEPTQESVPSGASLSFITRKATGTTGESAEEGKKKPGPGVSARTKTRLAFMAALVGAYLYFR